MTELKLNLEQTVRWQTVRKGNAQAAFMRVLSNEIARVGIIMVVLEEVYQVFPKGEFWEELSVRGWHCHKDEILGVAQVWS